jgi:hypothetical protein
VPRGRIHDLYWLTGHVSDSPPEGLVGGVGEVPGCSEEQRCPPCTRKSRSTSVFSSPSGAQVGFARILVGLLEARIGARAVERATESALLGSLTKRPP